MLTRLHLFDENAIYFCDDDKAEFSLLQSSVPHDLS